MVLIDLVKNRFKAFWELIAKIPSHLRDFSLIWVFLILIALGAIYSCKWVAYAGLTCVLLLVTSPSRPMNVVYGLIGTSGSIRIFFISFCLISFVFAGIFYWGFFNHSYISYDTNQPHVHFVSLETVSSDQAETCCSMTELDNSMARNPNHKHPVALSDTVFIHSENGILSFFLQPVVYQRVSFYQVLRNTITTSLIQEPTDLFAATAVFNQENYSHDGYCLHAKYDKAKSELFHWILILQILISWILFGVFISILYNKFRYES